MNKYTPPFPPALFGPAFQVWLVLAKLSDEQVERLQAVCTQNDPRVTNVTKQDGHIDKHLLED